MLFVECIVMSDLMNNTQLYLNSLSFEAKKSRQIFSRRQMINRLPSEKTVLSRHFLEVLRKEEPSM